MTPSGGHKEFRTFAKKIEKAGGEVRHGKSHAKVYHHGHFVGAIAITPSCQRTRLNEMSRLRRGGLEIR